MKYVPVMLVSVCCFICCTALAFDGVLGSSESCFKSCKMTYSLHTYPDEDELFACERGCRLFFICQFVSDSENLNGTKSECISACHEAYSGNEQYACSMGCENQLPYAQQRQEELLAMVPRMHLLYPLSLVRGIWSDMMGQAQELIFSSWTVYLQADNGKIVVFQTKPPVQDVYVREELKEEPYEVMGEPQYRDYSRSFVQERLGGAAQDQSDSENDYGFFSCLSKNFSQPSWILTTTLILSALVLNWLCCATMATASQQYVPAQKLSLYGDLEYMKEQKLIPYPPSSLVLVSSGKDEEARPLPSKINLDLTKI